MLSGKGLWFRYGAKLPWVVRDRTLAPGEVIGLMAPSDHGKNTLGKLLAGYLTLTQGWITLDDQLLYC